VARRKQAILNRYPHELSGGQIQRVMIAMAIACDPTLLIADEPTTALDVTVQAQIFDLLRELRDRRGMSMIFITHDLGIIAEIADQVAVMYQGQIVETGSVWDIFAQPQHPYTKGLLACRPLPHQRLRSSPRWRTLWRWCPTAVPIHDQERPKTAGTAQGRRFASRQMKPRPSPTIREKRPPAAGGKPAGGLSGAGRVWHPRRHVMAVRWGFF
jgi:peptide/nickel transport system ATP-binding protein